MLRRRHKNHSRLKCCCLFVEEKGRYRIKFNDKIHIPTANPQRQNLKTQNSIKSNDITTIILSVGLYGIPDHFSPSRHDNSNQKEVRTPMLNFVNELPNRDQGSNAIEADTN